MASTAPAPEIDEFLHWLAVEKGRAQNTLSAYRRDLVSYESFLRRSKKSVRTAKTETVRAFVHQLEKDGKSRRTVARCLVSVRALYRFSSDEGLLANDPAAVVHLGKLPKSLPKALTESEVEQLLAAPIGNEPSAVRDRAMLEVLYGTGVRISELVGLSTSDISIEDQIARVFGKGSKERVVPLGRYARNTLEHWMQVRDPWLHNRRKSRGRDDASAVFINARGTRLSRSGAWLILRGYADRVGIGERFSPHVLRHSCATHMLDHGADIRVVQELLGHASIATTQVYTKVSNERLRSAYEKAHPRARG